MSGLLRQLVESELATTLEGDFSLPVQLILPDPDGGRYTTSALDSNKTLSGQVLYNSVREDPETGERLIVNTPVVSLRIASLPRLPRTGEKWGVEIPLSPAENAPFVLFIMDSVVRAPEVNRAIGFVRLYLQKAEQVTTV